MIILGVDPGTRITGYGLIRVEANRYMHVDNGCIVPPRDADMYRRLTFIFEQLRGIAERHQPQVVALEKAFVAKNVATALKLGQCRGLAMVIAGQIAAELVEYSPGEIKLAVCGNGRAEKEQIQKMMCLLLKLPEAPQADAADALAVALCHGHHYPLRRLQAQVENARLKAV